METLSAGKAGFWGPRLTEADVFGSSMRLFIYLFLLYLLWLFITGLTCLYQTKTPKNNLHMPHDHCAVVKDSSPGVSPFCFCFTHLHHPDVHFTYQVPEPFRTFWATPNCKSDLFITSHRHFAMFASECFPAAPH